MRPYQEKILNFILMIPKGKVATYGQVAKATGIGSPRLVGRVLHNNPDPKRFPCHRVVFKDGSLAKNFAFGVGIVPN
jgi:methylated-DNA-protein-cysteine methyltransferase-like protein